MQPNLPLTCQACGTVVSALGGRCPSCGVMLEEVQRLQTPPPPRIMPRPSRSGGTKPELSPITLALAAMAVVVGLVAIVALIWQATREDDRATLPTARTPHVQPATPAPERPAVDVGLELGNAKAKAVEWHPDATLTSITLSDVRGSEIDPAQGAAMRFEFGKPADKKLGQGAPLGRERFVYTVRSSGASSETTTSTNPALGVGEPLCFEVASAARSAGAAAGEPLQIEFGFDAERNRGIWQVRVGSAAEVAHVLDGRTCAIVLR